MISNELIDMISPVLKSNTRENVIRRAKGIAENLGFSYYSAVSWDIANVTKPQVSISHNYPNEWEKLYIERSYFSQDPANKEHPLASPIYLWSSDGSSEVFNTARDFSINSGLTCSVRGSRFICSVSFAFQRDHIDNEMMIGAEFMAPYLANLLVRANEKETAGNHFNILTDREIECLRWVSAGKTSWEISVILSISERTVLFHLANSQRKLGTCSRTHSVAKAMILGLLKHDFNDYDPLIADFQGV